MSRRSAPYLSAAAGAAFAALCAVACPTKATTQEWQPDAQHLDCAMDAVSTIDFSHFEGQTPAETSLGVDEDGNITVAKSAAKSFGEQASVVITFTADEILAEAFHPGKPGFENDDFRAMEIIRLENGMPVYKWWTMQPDPPEGLLHRNFDDRRWALDNARSVAHTFIACINWKEKAQNPSQPVPLNDEEPLNRTMELEHR